MPALVSSDGLEGRVAIVTGAARGIGLATARLLAGHGARVLLVDLDAGALAAARADTPGDVADLTTDVTRPGAADDAMDAATARWGKVDIVVNNAGYALDGPIEELSDDSLQRMLDVHLVAPFRLCRAFGRWLRTAGAEPVGNRKVVNVSSISGSLGADGEAAYACGKAGLIGLTKTLAKEWAGLRVNVNAVAPGYADTRMVREPGPRGPAAVEIAGKPVPLGIASWAREEVLRLNPLGRLGTPEEIAGAILFLCSPSSDYVNGHVLTVSGGQIGGMSA